MTIVDVIVSQSVGAKNNKPFNTRFRLTDTNGLTGPQVPALFAPRASGIAVALGKLCGTETYFNRVTTRSFVTEMTGYDPNSFVTEPLSLRGSRGAGALPAIQEGKELTLNLFHPTTTGLPGKASIRNALFETDVSSVLGVWQLAEGSLAEPVYDAIQEFNQFMASALGDDWQLCVVTGTPEEYEVTTAKGEVFIRTRYVAPYTYRTCTESVFAKVGVRSVENRRAKRGTITARKK